MARAKRCSKPGCKAPAEKAEKCQRHYLQDWRAGERVRQVDDLGPKPVRFGFLAPRELADRFAAAVPKDERAHVIRRALADWLDRAKGAA